MGKQARKAKIVGWTAVHNSLPVSVSVFVAQEKEVLWKTIEDGYAAASRRQTSHLDTGTMAAQFVEASIDDWAELSSRELYKLEEELRPYNSWAGEVLHTIARIKEPQERAAREDEKEMCKQMNDAVMRARNQESEHMYFMMGLNLPRPLYREYDIHLERGKDGPVVVQYLHHVPSGERIREEIADVPTWVCDSKTLQKFVEEMHPRYWDGDFYED